jgi:DNA-directed RNA polymerase subunit RPC12/RpoP
VSQSADDCIDAIFVLHPFPLNSLNNGELLQLNLGDAGANLKWQMLQKALKTVPAPLISAAVHDAPPVLVEGVEPSVEYTCGNCGTALMRVDESKPHSLMVHCTACDAYNSTEI